MFFNFLQSLWEKIQEVRVQSEYKKEGSRISIFIKKIFCLAFLPHNRIN